MITELTPEQEKLCDVWVDKMIKVGLATGRCDRKAVEKACALAYKAAGLEMPKKVIWVDDPIQGMETCRKLEGGKKGEWDIYWPCYGQHDAPWVARHDYAREVLNLKKETEDAVGIIGMTQCGWWWPYDEAVVLCERPSELHLNEAGDMHKVGGPAIAWPSGYGQWYLNGVSVEQWMAEEDADGWTKEKVLGVENVEQRREMIIRYGKDRLWSEATVIDKADNYELGELSITGSRRIALCMKNPSTGTYHVEYVSPECRTVRQAINDRASRLKTPFKDWKPEQLT